MKKKFIIGIFSVLFILVITMTVMHFLNKDVEYLSKTFTGEGDLWSVNIDVEGQIEFYEKNDGELNSKSDMTEDVHIFYKGNTEDLSDITRVGIKSTFLSMSVGSTSGLKEKDLSFKGGGDGGSLLFFKNTEAFEITLYWEDDDYHEESFLVKLSN